MVHKKLYIISFTKQSSYYSNGKQAEPTNCLLFYNLKIKCFLNDQKRYINIPLEQYPTK